MTARGCRFFSTVVVIASTFLGLAFWKKEEKFCILSAVCSVPHFVLSISQTAYLIYVDSLPLVVPTFKRRGKISLGEYSFPLIVILTSIINGCIRFTYLKNVERDISSFVNYMKSFDSLISLPKRVHKKVMYFMMAIDAVVLVQVITRLLLVYEQYSFNCTTYKQSRPIYRVSFVLSMIEDISLVVVDVQMLQLCIQLFSRFKTVNINLRNLLIFVDKVIVTDLKGTLKEKKSKHIICEALELRKNKLQRVIDKWKEKSFCNRDEFIKCLVAKVNFSKEIYCLHTAFSYVYGAFTHSFTHIHFISYRHCCHDGRVFVSFVSIR